MRWIPSAGVIVTPIPRERIYPDVPETERMRRLLAIQRKFLEGVLERQRLRRLREQPPETGT